MQFSCASGYESGQKCRNPRSPQELTNVRNQMVIICRELIKTYAQSTVDLQIDRPRRV